MSIEKVIEKYSIQTVWQPSCRMEAFSHIAIKLVINLPIDCENQECVLPPRIELGSNL